MTQVNQDTQAKIAKLEAMLEEDTAKNMYRIDRAAFTDEELFELEMKHIFEGNWIFLAHESQIPNPNDYLNIYVGRQPVLITRDKTGQLHAMANTCTHRGATLARHKKGNKSSFTCPFHGWTFNNSGKLLKVKDQTPDAGYPECFNKDGSHDLVKLGAFENYRGFLFGSINPNVSSLADYLGEAAKIIDMIVDQAPDGIEVLRGTGSYTFDANWKLQAENGADGYHVTAVHWELRRHPGPPHRRRQGRHHQGHERRRLGSPGRWLLLLQERPHAAVDQLGQPGRPSPVAQARRVDRQVR